MTAASVASKTEPSPPPRVISVHWRICDARLSGNDLGCAAAGRGRVYLRLAIDLDGRERSDGIGQSHHRELGRRGHRLEPAEAAGAGRLGQAVVERVALKHLSADSAPSSLTRALLLSGAPLFVRRRLPRIGNDLIE